MLCAPLAAAALATAAQAQLDAGSLELGPKTGIDTDLTPSPKADPGIFKMQAGTRFGETEPINDQLPYDVNLYGVAFRDDSFGFAVGARCEEPDPEAETGCRPVIYASPDPDAQEQPRWKLAYSSEEPGFVGAIAFMPDGRAMAVGGTGAFPRRERPGCDAQAAERTGCDRAGQGRVWLYEQGSWRELTELPAGMRGMTALAFHPHLQRELGLAGALGQVWHWEGVAGKPSEGRFARVVDHEGFRNLDPKDTAAVSATHASRLRYRVRDIRIGPNRRANAVAVTSGCCGESADGLPDSDPRYLVYDEVGAPLFGGESSTDIVRRSWSVQTLTSATVGDSLHRTEGTAADPKLEPPSVRRDMPDAFYSAALVAEVGKTPVAPGAHLNAPADGLAVSFLATNSSPPGSGPAPDRASLFTQRFCLRRTGTATRPGTNTSPTAVLGSVLSSTDHAILPAVASLADPAIEATRTPLTSARLLASDGDHAKSSPYGPPGNPIGLLQGSYTSGDDTSLSPSTFSPNPPDGSLVWNTGMCGGKRNEGDAIPDWAVGELGSRRVGGRGAQGLAVATHLRAALFPDTVRLHEEHAGPDVRLVEPNAGSDPTDYRPTDQQTLTEYLETHYYLLPSYTINAIDVIRHGRAYAVGDHGAILSLDEGGAPASHTREGSPAQLGSPESSRLPERTGTAPQPAAGSAVPVPALATQPRGQLDEARLVGVGSPAATATPTLQERLQLAEFGFGSKQTTRNRGMENVEQLVMARDGQEGWAVGPNAGAAGAANGDPGTTLFHFDGASWSRCDPHGIPGIRDPDPACSEIAGLWTGGVPPQPSQKANFTSVRLVAVARVPLENDDDPSNDDEFEAVAIGTFFRDPDSADERPAIIRLRGGVWRFEPSEARSDVQFRKAAGEAAGQPDPSRRLRAVAFNAPDDGWISSDEGLLHFDGKRWAKCTPGREAECGSLRERGGITISGMRSAGERTYLFGRRFVGDSTGTSTSVLASTTTPVILYREKGRKWTSEGGGFDPGFGFDQPGLVNQGARPGLVRSLAVARRPDGRYEGWAIGGFAGYTTPQSARNHWRTALLRLHPDGTWRPFFDQGPLGEDLPRGDTPRQGIAELEAVSVGPRGTTFAVAHLGRTYAIENGGPRSRLVPTPRPVNRLALAPDGDGGIWVAAGAAGASLAPRTYFFHLTDRPRKPVLDEVPNPFTEPSLRVRALAAGGDGSVWAATNADVLARYDRMSGWDTTRIPGWDRGKVVTRESEVNAIAIGPDGSGVVVGKQGRIANVHPDRVALDRAAGTLCDLRAPDPPCGTGRDLRAAAVGPDGSAMVGGDRLALLWRPAGEEFRSIAKPPASALATITGISLPDPATAYLTTSRGEVWAGRLSGGQWAWALENRNGEGRLLTLNAYEQPRPLRAIAVGADGSGYAVGHGGVVLRRSRDRAQPWRVVPTRFLDDLVSVALPVGGGEGVLIGGRNGLVLTGEGERIELARPAEHFIATAAGQVEGDDGSGLSDARVQDAESNTDEVSGPAVGVAILPGPKPGQVEAWAAIRGKGAATNQILHYSSDPGEPLLNSRAGHEPLPDAPAPRPGEVRFAAFGKTDCHLVATPAPSCPPSAGTNADNEVISTRIVEELRRLGRSDPGLDLSIFTGDAVDTAGAPTGRPEHETFDRNNVPPVHDVALGVTLGVYRSQGTADGLAKLRRWREFVADPLASSGLPLLGAIGAQDLSSDFAPCPLLGFLLVCSPRNAKQDAKAGDNLTWREAMADQPAPWGGRAPATSGEERLVPVPGGGLSVEHSDRDVPDPDGPPEEHSGHLTEPSKLRLGGARTHYAVDLVAGDEPHARFVFLDNSLRSLAASDPAQNPVEAEGGQARWLERMLCFRDAGDSPGQAGGRCTRRADQKAVVVANTPTYSYGPVSPTELATDAAALEAILLRGKVSLLVSGRLGWNGFYWATAPGVHEPCPGEGYQSAPPEPGTRACGRGVPQGGSDPSEQLEVAESLESSVGPPVGVPDDSRNEPLGEILPVLVASGGGGALAARGDEARAARGFWYGYAIARLDPSGDPRKTVVEQRPIMDWVTIRGVSHVLRPGQRMTLAGYFRGPLMQASALAGAQAGTSGRYAEFKRVDSPAVTHRYDLLEADPEDPSRARQDADGNYVPLDPSVATVDSQTGQVRAGRGNHPRAYAIGLLSVGQHAASWPLVFEPRRSFVPRAGSVLRQPPLRPVVLSQPPSPPPPPPAAPPQSSVPAVTPPAPPAAPAAPPLAPPTAAPQPPPPPPPAQQPPQALDLLAQPVGLTIAPTASVIPPPAPPIQPAPPGGARREARQRQAATAKSEEGAGSEGGASEARESGGDPANGPPSPDYAMTRSDRVKPGPSFTTVSSAEQPSAWARGALYGGGLTLAALLMAAGWTRARPTPKRREPELPAPAWARLRR